MKTMKRILIAFAAVAFLTGLADGAEDGAGKIFAEVRKLVADAESKSPPGALEDLRGALKLLDHIVDKYPASDISIRIVADRAVDDISRNGLATAIEQLQRREVLLGRDAEIRELAALSGGGMVAVGVSGGAEGATTWARRLDARGNTVWERPLATGDYNFSAFFASLVVLRNQEAIVSGVRGKDPADVTLWVSHLGADGRMVREVVLPRFVMDLAVLSDGRLVMLCTASENRTFLRVLDSGLELIVEKAFEPGKLGYVSEIAAMPDDGLALVGSKPASDDAEEIWILRLNADFEPVWETTIPNRGQDRSEDSALAVAASGDGHLVVAGRKVPAGEERPKAWAARLDGDGKVVWHHQFGRARGGVANAATILPTGAVVVAGKVESNSLLTRYGWIAALNSEGDVLWEKVDDQSSRTLSAIQALAVLPDGGLATGGTKRPGASKDLNAWLLVDYSPEVMALTAR